MNMTTFYVYKITNKINGKIYIGKSKNIAIRFAKHIKIAETFLESDNHFQAIHGAIKKYGKENFILDTIEVCDENNINEKEIYWISFLKTQDKIYGYNLTSGGDGATNRSEESINKWRIKMLGKKHSREHNRKISESNKGKIISQSVREKISKANLGENNGMFNKTHSTKTKEKMIKSHGSRKFRKPLSEEHKEKNRIAASKQDHSFRIPQETKEQIISMYDSGNYTKRQLAEKYNIKYNSVVKILRVIKTHTNENESFK